MANSSYSDASDRQNIRIYQYIRLMLRPLARVMLKRGIGYGEFAEAAKAAFVDAAQIDLAIPGRKQTTSRISTITGLSRKEVHRLLNQDEAEQVEALHKLNRAARVISGWLSDPRFVDAQGQPSPLSFEEGDVSFTLLVKDYSGDITPRTIADELSRTGAIEQDSEGKLHLVKQAYIPDSGSIEQFKLLSENLAELTSTIEHNIEHEQDKYFQRKVYYDNIPVESVNELKQVISDKAQKCLEEINSILVQHDRDHHPEKAGTKRMKLGLAMHYIQEEQK
jgi:hypothetical protein